MSLAIENIIIDLCNSNKPLLNSALAELSNLNTTELDAFTNSWMKINPSRRSQIIQRLVELAEDNLELNFYSIFKYGLKDPEPEVKRWSIEGLWENEESSLIKPLITLLEQDESEKVQETAVIALGKFALLAEYKKLHPDHITIIQEALLTTIHSKNKTIEVRRRALEAVAPIGIPKVKGVIMEAYQSHHPKFKISSIHAMGKNCASEWLPILIKELTSTDAEIRYEAAGACGELEEEKAIPNLIKLTSDPDGDVQMATIQALGKIGGEQAKKCLQQCLDNSNEAIKQAAKQLLNEMEINEGQLPF
ncbi:HEAT repeat domain-containing protein [Chloroflexota bacterium]